MKNPLAIPLAICLGGVILATAVYVSMREREPSTRAPGGNPAAVAPVSAQDHIFGNPAAPVKIVEYSDFECDYCKSFNGILQQVIADEGATGKVAWVFRSFPLTEIHPNAFQDALAAECAAQAGGNGAFWSFAGLLFKNQPVNPNDYGALASQAGVPGDAFSSCMLTASSTFAARINANRQNAFAAGAQGTPYSLILAPGESPIVVDGAYSADDVKQMVEQALANSKN